MTMGDRWTTGLFVDVISDVICPWCHRGDQAGGYFTGFPCSSFSDLDVITLPALSVATSSSV